MVRIFASLAVFAIALLVADLIAGLRIGCFNQAAVELVDAQRQSRIQKESDDTRREQVALAAAKYAPLARRASVHRMLGIAASLVTILVNSISITYFIGTSRWCREVVDAYRLDPALARHSAMLKRKTFPWSLLGILVMLGVAAVGAACDPGTGYLRPQWVTPHVVTAIGGTMFIAVAFFYQVRRLRANHRLIEEILERVRVVRETHAAR